VDQQQPQPEQLAPDTIPQQPSPGNGRRKYAIIGVVLLIAIGSFVYWLTSRGKISTDDAQIEGNLVPISSRVSGYVRAIDVEDNQYVRAGQALVTLDGRDLEVKVRQMEAALATARAQSAAASGQVSVVAKTAPAGARQAGAVVGAAGAGITAAREQVLSAQAQVNSAGQGVGAARAAVGSAQGDLESATAQIEVAESSVKVAQADVSSAEANAKRAASDYARYQKLADSGAISMQQLEVSEAANTTAQAGLAAARNRVESAQAALKQAKARRASAQAVVKQASARLGSAQAALVQAKAGVGAARAIEAQAHAGLSQAQAAELGARSAPQQIQVSEAQRKAAEAKVRQAEADLANARLQLSYTRIVAPVDGIISKKSVQLGQYLQPGQALMAIVPLAGVWVVANFKETQTGKMHPGQRAIIEVDSYPGMEFEGRVQSIGAATGAKFSLLPPENATGNFVKVVQRIPVKIVLTKRIPKGVVLRPGLNVFATVRL